ncbi:27 kDa glycoprotein-like [Rhagoletis pomonella]|uniref:27 kDa glycoprotein-like n=1 Tax=Rhagoletis pomonella TaxID=28610 RepID=UPI001785247E|nr:27 kDa glycoprotein-like [Rhagoletis pomonella]
MKRSLIATVLLSLAFLAVDVNNVYGSPSDSDIDLSQINVNDLQQKLPAELANTNLTLDDAKTLVRDKCIEVAGKENGEAAYAEIENAVSTLTECATNILNFTAIQVEIDEASPKGELDVVFNKYCNKQPQALACFEAFNSKLAACLDNEEKEHQEVFMRIVRSLLSFICHKGGDQIALFIAEKGPECLDSKKDDIQKCVNSTFAGYVPQNGLSDIKTLPKFVMGTKQCEEMEDLENCIVEKLEKCSEITPANIVESMFRFIKNETICHSTPRVAKQSSWTSGVNSAVMLQQLGGVSWMLGASLFYQLIKLVQV